MDRYSEIWDRTEWFRQSRFGLFLHWGLYSIPGRGEWVRSEERLTVADYEKYFEEFDPKGFDPKEWARAAKRAGMKYAVLTAKHHDGFCLFDSALTDYKSTNTACGRDLVREFLEAFRAEGLKVGLYFSLLDWHHPDYPTYHDAFAPLRDDENEKGVVKDFDRYLDYMHAQIEELVTGYGKLDILWFDFSYDEMRGEKWRASKLVEMVRKYQPDVIMDNRLETSGEGFGSLVEEDISAFSGDFVSPEQLLPPEGIRNVKGDPVPWELCCTMNNHWGYCPADYDYKSSSMLIRKLVECVSKGGNMILNAGPDAEGRFSPQTLLILSEIGDWMEKNSESIYGCTQADLAKPEWGRYTKKGNVIYAHIMEQPLGPIPLIGLKTQEIKSIRRLSDGSETASGKSWVTAAYGELAFACLGDVPQFTYPLPDPVDTVLKVTLK